ncbi:MAG: hypothetical protein ISS57_15325 [Anaerolineales bacterium]|nr:hypothetical protein [Anaerolineales bacterium]
MKMLHSKRFFLLITGLLLIAFLAGCNMPGSGGEADKGLMSTLARQTVSAKLTQAILETQIASGQAPTATDSTAPEQSATPENTATQQYTNTPGPTPTNTPLPCNWAQFVDDVTIPDNTELVAGTVFTKTWRLKNIGTCDWTSGYRLIFDSGDQMNAPNDSQFTSGTVPSGATADISVDLVAPSAAGTYQGNFLLRSSDNVVFGLGGNADGNFWVKIVALAPSATPTATSTSTETATPTSTPTPTDTPTVAAKPDLIINLLELNPATPTQGNPVDVTVQVYNQGNALAVGPFTVAWYPGENYPAPACTWNVDNVNAMGGRVLTCTYAGYPSQYATINTKAVADTTNTVDESDEGNNSMLVPITVNP